METIDERENKPADAVSISVITPSVIAVHPIDPQFDNIGLAWDPNGETDDDASFDAITLASDQYPNEYIVQQEYPTIKIPGGKTKKKKSLTEKAKKCIGISVVVILLFSLVAIGISTHIKAKKLSEMVNASSPTKPEVPANSTHTTTHGEEVTVGLTVTTTMSDV